MHEGKLVWSKGRQVMKTERLVRQIVTSRDGLETLATSHLDADGEVRVGKDGKPIPPGIDRIQYAAGMRFCDIYERADPERGLRAVDPESAGGGRQPVEAFARATVLAIQQRADRNGALEAICKRLKADAGEEALFMVVAVAGQGKTVRSIAPSGRRNQRLTAALIDGLDCLADYFGLT